MLRIAALAVVVALAACAGNPPSTGPLQPAPSQSCSGDEPIDTVSVADLFDEAALGILQHEGAIVSLEVDSLGMLETARLVEGPAGVAGEVLVEGVRAAYHDEGVEVGRMGARLVLPDGGGAPELRTRVGCGPQLTDASRARMQRDLQQIVRQSRHVHSPLRFEVQVVVGADGRARNAQIMDGPRIMELHQPLLDAARRLRFHPGILDGEPRDLYTRIPLTLLPPR
jgi:hypothetical protein